MTYDQVITLTTLISAVQGISFTDDTKTRAWFSLLEDLDFEPAHLALKKLLRTETFNITPAHIRRACDELSNPQIDSAKAVELVFRTLRICGRDGWRQGLKNIEDNDPIAYIVVKSIGYIELCDSNPEFTRPEFEKLYKETAKNMQTERVLSPNVLDQIGEFKDRILRQNLAMLGCDD